MARFEQVRHKSLSKLDRPRPLIVACPQLQSHVNLSKIVRMAGCCGVGRVIACGNAKLDRDIARDGADSVKLEIRRTLRSPLRKLKSAGFHLVGLEQTSNSQCLYDFVFERQTALVLGHERQGITDDILGMLDHVVEIPVFGLPYSHNVATAAAMALYEYCRQFPNG